MVCLSFKTWFILFNLSNLKDMYIFIDKRWLILYENCCGLSADFLFLVGKAKEQGKFAKGEGQFWRPTLEETMKFVIYSKD